MKPGIAAKNFIGTLTGQRHRMMGGCLLYTSNIPLHSRQNKDAANSETPACCSINNKVPTKKTHIHNAITTYFLSVFFILHNSFANLCSVYTIQHKLLFVNIKIEHFFYFFKQTDFATKLVKTDKQKNTRHLFIKKDSRCLL